MADISKVKLTNGNTYTIKDAAVRSRVDTIESTLASALVFQGVVSTAAAITGLTNYKKGWTYKASAIFSIPNVGLVENGDMIIAIDDYSGSWDATDWTIVQNNIDTMLGATASEVGTRGLVPAPAAGDQNKFLSGAGTWEEAVSNSVFVATYGTTTYADIKAAYDAGKFIYVTRALNGTTTYLLSDFTGTAFYFRSFSNSSTTNYGCYVTNTDAWAVNSYAYATTSSPTFTGTPKAPTAAKGTNTTQIATTAFVQTAVETATTKQYTATLSAADWVSSSGTYTYALVLTSLTCGSDGTVSPIISYTSNQTEYNYITNATATAGTGITFTASQKPSSDIDILIIDLT